MHEIIDKNICSGCHACQNVCPRGCIAMIEDNEGFLYPHIDDAKCSDCGLCKKVCPLLSNRGANKKGRAYACINRDENIRTESSSGGVFTLLAEEIIKSGGVVFGAAFDANLGVRHTKAETIDELYKMRGSKYAQSRIGNTYTDAKAYLEDGKTVLFSGTPCQISGLKRFLGKDYKNLITQDLICHGAPSPKVWRKYLEYLSRRADAEITGLPSFRSKKRGWKNYSVSVKFKNNTEYCRVFREDLFMKAFLSNLSLRPSCYRCHEKSAERESDITLGDFWGAEKVVPDMDDDKGISLVLINSEKGRKIFDAVSGSMLCRDVDFDAAAEYNPSLTKSPAVPKKRGKFMHVLNRLPFDKAVISCTKRSLLRRALNKAKMVIGV